MIEVIKSPTPVVEKKQWTAFLAGPMNGAPSWQAQAPKVAAQVGIENLTLLNPRKTQRFVTDLKSATIIQYTIKGRFMSR